VGGARRFSLIAVVLPIAAVLAGCGARTGLIAPEPRPPADLAPWCDEKHSTSGYTRLPFLTFITQLNITGARLEEVTYELDVLCLRELITESDSLTQRPFYYDMPLGVDHLPSSLTFAPPLEEVLGTHTEADRHFFPNTEDVTIENTWRGRWCIRYRVRFRQGGNETTLSRWVSVDRNTNTPIVFTIGLDGSDHAVLFPPAGYSEDCHH
jgi:hypothetical protein